jgi:hypothetical protein
MKYGEVDRGKRGRVAKGRVTGRIVGLQDLLKALPQYLTYNSILRVAPGGSPAWLPN